MTERKHLILIKNEHIVPVPKHKEIKRGLLMEIMSEAGLTKEEFLGARALQMFSARAWARIPDCLLA
jgi:hypothetical protein